SLSIDVRCDVNTSYPAHSSFRQHLLPLLFTYSAVLHFTIPDTYLANIHQCDRFLSRIYWNAQQLILNIFLKASLK
ncbi:hypothetical protein OEZ66_35865, partial [Escherichia coli]|nr:hypothetical protein [Escherichia coli]